ncbi:MAG: AAA family ATPase [Chloroflexota bacterium]
MIRSRSAQADTAGVRTRATKVVSIVGMAGAGKSAVARLFERAGFARIRFGDITDQELERRGLIPNEENERYVRQQLRQEHGMSAYAKLNLSRIEAALRSSDVVVDGLYSWEEYIFLKDRLGDRLALVAVWASAQTRHGRLGTRRQRPLTAREAYGRDRDEIEKGNKGGPIAIADFLIVNEGPFEHLEKEAQRVLSVLGEHDPTRT